MTVSPVITAIGTATPDHDVHAAFIGWARARLGEREARLFDRMVDRAGIDHRFSILPPAPGGGSPVDAGGFYDGDWPGTQERMARYADAAPVLAEQAVKALGRDVGDVTHLVLASCTGFVAPGIDQLLARRLGLPGSIERTLVGFMGCYAAVAALRSAYHIVRSQPGAKVLVVSVELSSLHLQARDELEPLLSMLLFGDGAAAAIVEADGEGLALSRPFAATLDDSSDLIRWDITDTGFAMHLSGEVPGRIAAALDDQATRAALLGDPTRTPDALAIHAGGRSVLDAVERGMAGGDVSESRGVLADFGNMSSATLLFVLARMMDRDVCDGLALAFGPGLAAEGFDFCRTA